MNSALFANVFGGHAFVGMNVYYQEEELRKQADVFTGKVLWVCERLINFVSVSVLHLVTPLFPVLSAETSTTDRPLREDLHKKMMSADTVAARLTQAIVTKMVSTDGWKVSREHHREHLPVDRAPISCYLDEG